MASSETRSYTFPILPLLSPRGSEEAVEVRWRIIPLVMSACILQIAISYNACHPWQLSQLREPTHPIQDIRSNHLYVRLDDLDMRLPVCKSCNSLLFSLVLLPYRIFTHTPTLTNGFARLPTSYRVLLRPLDSHYDYMVRVPLSGVLGSWRLC
jgi:hypothetical protein